MVGKCRLVIFDWKTLGEIPGDDSFTHELAVSGNGDEVLKAVVEAGEDLVDVGHADLPANWCGVVALEGLPESIACQMADRVGIVC